MSQTTNNTQTTNDANATANTQATANEESSSIWTKLVIGVVAVGTIAGGAWYYMNQGE